MIRLVVASLHVLLVIFLVFIFPAWDVYEARRLRAQPSSRARLRLYRIIIVWNWIVAVVLLVTVPIDSLLSPLSTRWSAGPEVVIGLIVGISVAIAAALLGARRADGTAVKSLQPVEFMLPQNSRERWWWAVAAISAGICEEIIFRGFLIRYFAQWIGTGGGVLAAAAVFALDHAYQGVRGMITTFAVGLLFTALFFITGSLWLPMAFHVALDLRVLAVRRTNASQRLL